MKKALIVDDHEIVTGAMSFVLGTAYNDVNCSVVGTFEEAKSKIARETFDIAILDVQLPDGTGSDLIPDIRQTNPQTKVILFTGAATSIELKIGASKGANFIISKAEPTHLIANVLQMPIRKQVYLSPKIASQLESLNAHKSLSIRMQQVLQELANGNSNKEIAHNLQIEVPTVSFHTRNLRERLGAKNNREAVTIAKKIGYLAND